MCFASSLAASAPASRIDDAGAPAPHPGGLHVVQVLFCSLSNDVAAQQTIHAKTSAEQQPSPRGPTKSPLAYQLLPHQKLTHPVKGSVFLPGLISIQVRPTKKRRRTTWLTPQIYLLAAVFPVFIAMSLAWFVELDHPAASNPVQVEVTGDPGTPSQEFFADISVFSTNRKTAVALFTTKIDNPTERILHATTPAGSDTSHWLTAGYPGGFFNKTTTVVPLDHSTVQSAAGMYLVYGTTADAEQFTLVARKHGYAAGLQDISPWRILTSTTALLYGLISCAILGATALVASTISKAREYAITRFWGTHVGTVIGRELLSVLVYLKLRLAALLALATATAIATGNAAGIGHVAAIAAPLVTILMAITVMVHIVAVTATYYLPNQLSALRGDAGHTPVMSLTYAARLPVVFLLAFTVVGLASSTSAFTQTHRALSDLNPAGSAERLAVSGKAAQSAEEQSVIFDGVGTWLTEIDRLGKAVITQPMLLDPTTVDNPVSTHPVFSQGPVPMMLVNSTYLNRHHVATTHGERLQVEPKPSQLTIAVPADLEEHRNDIEAEILAELDLNVRPEYAGNLTVTPASLAADQEMFTYGAEEFSDPTSSATLHSPVLVVVPDALLTPAFYASLAGQGGILLTDPTAATADLESTPHLAQYVRWIQPPATSILRTHQENLCQLAASAIAVLFLGTALILTSLAVSLIYRTDQAQRTRIRGLYGWSLWRTCRLALAWETALCTVVVIFFVNQFPRFAPGEISPDLARHFTEYAVLQLVCAAAVITLGAVSLLALLHRAYTNTKTVPAT